MERARRLYGDELDITLAIPAFGAFHAAVAAHAEVVVLGKKTRPALGFALLNLVRLQRPDIILCNNDASFLMAVPAALLSRKKILWQVKNMRRAWWSDALCFLLAHRILFISPQIVENKSAHLVRWFEAKIFVLPIGTRLGDFLALPAPSCSSASPRALVLCRVQPDKGIDMLVDALAALDARGVGLHLRLAGGTPQGGESFASAMKSRTKDFCHVRVDWLGWRDDIVALLGWAQILVHPSRKEGVPRCIVEAMAAGRPVIATDVGGTRSILVDGEQGFLIASGDAQSLAQRIEQLAMNPELTGRLGAAGRARARVEFDIDTHVRRLKGHLDAVLEQG
ncbi:MAG: glycosyltransferase [Sinobacteraceae bacterium]|nr:glycosyltransferase [Nevskiaceae bacterium]